LLFEIWGDCDWAPCRRGGAEEAAVPPRNDLNCDFNSGISDSPSVCVATWGPPIPSPQSAARTPDTASWIRHAKIWVSQMIMLRPLHVRWAVRVGRADWLRTNGQHPFADWLTYLGADWYGWNQKAHRAAKSSCWTPCSRHYSQRKILVIYYSFSIF